MQADTLPFTCLQSTLYEVWLAVCMCYEIPTNSTAPKKYRFTFLTFTGCMTILHYYNSARLVPAAENCIISILIPLYLCYIWSQAMITGVSKFCYLHATKMLPLNSYMATIPVLLKDFKTLFIDNES
jgi:hypothetical protein